ncbi:MAG: hypothetical protein U9O86_01380, partial [Campylobacterota bacterium]|nr:hypothetical protein [Campylobacterota bacterium]
MKHFFQNLTLFLSLLFILPQGQLLADDICYTGIEQEGFIRYTKTSIPIKNISDQTLEDVKFYVDETGLGFEWESDCGTDAVDGSCDGKSNIEMGPFGFLGDTTEYILNDLSSNQIVDTWTQARFDIGVFTSLDLYATYEKDGLLRKAKVSKCSDVQGTEPVTHPDPEYEECGIFPSALSTWDVIYPANGDVVIAADTIYADDVDGAVKCSATDEYQNVAQLDVCAVDELIIDEPILPDNIPSTLTTSIDISGNLYEANYPNISLIGDTRLQATQHYDNDPSKRAFMSIDSLVSTASGITLTLTEGDYYFGSWANNADLIVRMEGPVTIYIDGDMTLNNNHLDFNYNEGSGVPSDAYVFIGGNFTMTSSGGGSGYDMVAYVLAQGTFYAGTNTNNSSFQGAISSVGRMTLNNNQTYTYDPSGLEDDGFGECPPLPTPYTTGPFDAWDTFRDNVSTPPSDRNISTKIVNNSFNLSLASLNKESDAYELKEGLGDVDVAIYPKNSNTAISNHIIFNPGSSSHVTSSSNFTVTQAESDAVVGFKLCATFEHNETVNESIYYLYPTTSCSLQTTLHNCDTETNGSPTWHVCHSSDNFAIRPHTFKVFGENQYKRAAEDFNLLIKAIDENNDSITSGSHTIVQGLNGYDVSTATISTVSNFYVPTSSELAQMRVDTGVTDVSTCPQAGVFTLQNANFINGELNATIKFSETGILDINISEVPGSEYALVDADDTTDTLRYIQSTVFIYDQSDISRQNLLLFVPYQFITTAEYNATTTKDWLYMHDINTSNTSFTTPLMSANIFYTIVAKNKDGATTQNYTKTCFPDVDEVNAPRVNGLKLNTTFDLFLDATINSTANASLSLYSEDNASTALYTPTKNLNAVVGDNVMQEWISPLQFSNGQGNARVHLNIDRVNNVSLNPVNLKLVDINTSTSWMANPGSPKLFTGQVLNIDKSFIYGRTYGQRQKFVDGSTPANHDALIYYES